MKKIIAIIALVILIAVCCVPTVALANSAMPDVSGVGSGVTFDTYYDVQVTSEVLDIVFDGRTATVTATYTMVNLTSTYLDVYTMFILPSEDTGKGYSCIVTQDGNALEYTTSNYVYADYNTSLTLDDWQYIVENGNTSDYDDYDDYGLQIATVNYTMSFDPNATSTIVVSYDTQLGGSVSYNTTVELMYYLTPAQYWADFSDLTINLTLDETHPSLDKSSTSLSFTKTGQYTYQYTSDSLPDTELVIVAQESLIDRMTMSLLMILFFLAVPLAVIAFIVSAIVVVIILIVKSVRDKKGYTVQLRSNQYFAKRGWISLIIFGVLVVLTAIAIALHSVSVLVLLVMIIVDIVGVIGLLVYTILLLDAYRHNKKALQLCEQQQDTGNTQD